VDRVQGSANPFVELRIANRDQPGQEQPAPACADERLRDSAHRAIVGQQDPASGEPQRVLADALNQSGGKCVGERAVGGNGEDGGAFGRPLRHSRAPLPSSGSSWAYRRRTTAPGGLRRNSGPPRSRGPTEGWSRTARRAHRAAGASTSFERR